MKPNVNNLFGIPLVAFLLLGSSIAHASSGEIPWQAYLIVGATISLVGAFILSKRNENVEGAVVKVLLAGLYFWIITFAQLTLFAIIYQLSK